MIKLPRLLIVFFLIINSSSFSQKLKRSDRMMAESMQSHVNFLSEQRSHAADGEQKADEYVAGQLRKAGLKALGDSGAWMQRFTVPDGTDILGETSLSINAKPLVLYTDYFPFSFSASKKTEASVAMALAETGVPWFVELKELLDENEDSAQVKDTSSIVATRAKRAAAKGATALIVYNNSIISDIAFDKMDSVEDMNIPVVYITHAATARYLTKESSLLDVKMNIAMKKREKTLSNVVGYIDNKADSAAIIAARLDDEKDVAALLEFAKLLKGKQYRFLNYLFIVYPGERRGEQGINYFNAHPSMSLQKVNYTLNLDAISEKGLPQITQGLTAINTLKHK